MKFDLRIGDKVEVAAWFPIDGGKCGEVVGWYEHNLVEYYTVRFEDYHYPIRQYRVANFIRAVLRKIYLC